VGAAAPASAAAPPVRRIREESIVTGEAVELEIRPASPLLRAGAALADDVLLLIGLLVLDIGILRLLDEPTSSMQRILAIGSVLLVLVILPFAVETLTRGRSLGKWAFGLSVVRADGGVITARHSLMRAVTGILEIWATLGSVALVTALVTPRSQRLGDLAAGTMVVRLPDPVRHAPLIMPPDLGAWASGAQVLPCPPALQAEALGFLRSNAELAPEIRRREAVSLATRLSRHVAPAPPPGTDPERFVAAVLVVLRDREYARLLARDERAGRRRAQVDQARFGVGSSPASPPRH
jgi:uncharacterized RDD family membrane protein YckC